MSAHRPKRGIELRGESARERGIGRSRADAAPSHTTLIVVAPNALVREGLRSVICATAGLSVIGEADDVRDAVTLAIQHKPHAVLLDAPPSDSIDSAALSALRRSLPATCILCLARSRAHSIADVLCVPSNAGAGDLCSVLEDALGGRCRSCALQPTCAAPRIAVALSRREKQVAVCIARGMPSKHIAAALGIGLRTVNTYRESLARKLGASSAAVVTRFVLETKLDSPQSVPHAV